MYEMRAQSRGLVAHGISTCVGCGMELIMRNVLDVLGSDVTIVVPPGCSAMFCGFSNETVVKVPMFQANLENCAACASGISRGYRLKGNDHTVVVAFAGDGGTLDIGLQSLSGMMERGEDVLYICYDNEAYMNTGIQGSSSTPYGAWTTTTPGGKPEQKKDLLGIAMAHGVPYCASASVANIQDMRKKIAKAKDIRGPRVVHIHCPCPTGWQFPPEKSIEICRNAVATGAWVLYECENGRIRITFKPKELKPVEDYLKYQGRFKKISQTEIDALQTEVRRHYMDLIKREADE